MSFSPMNSWRRFIFTTLLWSMALLLLTNVAWSAWFSRRFGEAYRVQFMAEVASSPRDWPLRIETRRGRRLSISRSLYAKPDSMWLTQFNVTAVSIHLPNFSPTGLAKDVTAATIPNWVNLDRWRHERSTSASDVEHEMYVGVGWPVHVLWCRWVRQGSAFAVDRSTAIIRSNDPLPWIGQVDNVLPFRPIWSGQLLTGAMWFGAIALLRGLLHLLRHGLRDIRRWRGLCTQCAYNLRGNVSGVCPECGAAAQGRELNR